MGDFHAELMLPNDPAGLPMLRTFVREFAALGLVAETGQAVVSPAHRGRKLFERMRALLGEQAVHLGLAGLFGQPVTSHTFSQQEEESVGAHGFGAGIIRVRRVGRDSAAEGRRARQDLCDTAAAEVVYLELPLARAGTPHLCEAAESDGFFFSGLGPHFAPDGDALRLQYLNCELDMSGLRVFSPFGRELLDYVAAERSRVSRH